MVSLYILPPVLHHLPPRHSQANFFTLNLPPPVEPIFEVAELHLLHAGVTRHHVGVRHIKLLSSDLLPMN